MSRYGYVRLGPRRYRERFGLSFEDAAPSLHIGWTEVALPQPVRPGETISAESTVKSVRTSKPRPDQGVATVETRAFNEKDELLCSYQRVLLIYKRGAGRYEKAGY